MSRIFALELNEIPPGLLEEFIENFPDSNLAKIQKFAEIKHTIADDIPEEDLYPSQSWASLNSGVPFKTHKVKWYNDSKENCPQIWDRLATKHSVGVVNCIHSSDYQNNFKYYIPDPYKKNSKTIPKKYEGFQTFKINQVFKSGRVSKVGFGPSDFLSLLSFAKDISLSTYFEAAKTLVTRKKGKPERLRNIEFLLHADLYLKLLNTNADINVFFTNHVASQMHRYIGAHYPNQDIIDSFGESWIQNFSDEITYSLKLFDKFLGKLLKKADLEKDVITISSSMGQKPKYISTSRARDTKVIYVNKPEVFWSLLLGERFEYAIEGAMVPQLTLKMGGEDAIAAAKYLESVKCENITFEIDVNSNRLTTTARITAETVHIDGKKYSISEIGATYSCNDLPNTGVHSKEGIFWVASQSKAVSPGSKAAINYLEYAQQIEKLASTFIGSDHTGNKVRNDSRVTSEDDISKSNIAARTFAQQ